MGAATPAVAGGAFGRAVVVPVAVSGAKADSGITTATTILVASAMLLGRLLGGSLLSGTSPGSVSFVGTAYAWIGHPATPVSCAGVARRTTRRTLAATTAYRY